MAYVLNKQMNSHVCYINFLSHVLSDLKLFSSKSFLNWSKEYPFEICVLDPASYFSFL